VEFEVCSIPAEIARTMDTYSAFEYQRFEPIVGWGHDLPGHLLPTDPGRWASGDGKKWGLKFDDVVPQMPEGYEETAPWSVWFGEENDADGWEYGVDFGSHNWYSKQSQSTYARRRMYTREVILGAAAAATIAAAAAAADAAAAAAAAADAAAATTTTAAAVPAVPAEEVSEPAVAGV
jgi:hypothetical protein